MRPITRKLLKGVHRTVGSLLPPTLLSFSVPSIPGRIHVDDQMLGRESDDALTHYSSDAGSAIENIEASLAAAGRRWSDVAACLDLPSGYGRVTRLLIERIPPSRITACDVDRQAVRFCAAEFGVRPLFSTTDLRHLRFPTTYDLVFVGSLLTHLRSDACWALIEALANAVSAGGVLVFTTQGESCLGHLEWYGADFAAAQGYYRATLSSEGVAFRPYGAGGDYGVTLHGRAYVEREMVRRFGDALALVRFAERGWDDHQDVWSFVAR